jgi:hypothetical protein
MDLSPSLLRQACKPSDDPAQKWTIWISFWDPAERAAGFDTLSVLGCKELAELPSKRIRPPGAPWLVQPTTCCSSNPPQ